MPTVAERRKEMNEGLAQDIKEIKSMLATMQSSEAARCERERAMKDELDKIKDTVNGNGKPGLKTDVQVLMTNDEKRGKNQNTIIVAIIIQIIMMVLTKVL
jgi:hypothetical protein